MKRRLITIIVFTGTLLTCCAQAQTTWVTDVEEGKKDAAKNNKNMLIVFTGSDWNDQSKDLITDVFTDEFFKKGSKKYVLCNVDIVKDKTLMDATQLQTNYTIASQYNVQSLPLFVLLTPDGDVYGTTSVTDETGTIDGLLNLLATFDEAKEKLVDLKKKINSSEGVEKAQNIDLFIEAVDPSQREQYADLIRQVPDLDSDGTAGLKGKYQLQAAYLDALALYQAGDLTSAGDCFIKLTEGSTLDPAQLQQAWYMGAYMYAMSGGVEEEKVIGLLEKAVAADPQNPGSAQIQATIDELKTHATDETDAEAE